MAADKVIGVPSTSGFVNDVEEYRFKHKLGSTAEAMRELANKQLERDKRLEGRVMTEDNSGMAAVGENTKQRFMQMWTENMFENYEIVRDDMQPDRPLGGALMDLKDIHRGQPAVITGSGPSFDYSVPFLKEWKGQIICGPTQIQTLLHHGIKPKYIVAYDANPDFIQYMQTDKVPKEDYEGITLLTTPAIDPWCVHTWAEKKYPRKWFLTFTSNKADPLEQDPPMTVKQWLDFKKPIAEAPLANYVDDEFHTLFLRVAIRAFLRNERMRQRGIKAEGVQPLLYNTGSTPNQSVLVADFLGCYPIFMMGNDLCYAEDGRERAITYHLNKKKERVPMELGDSGRRLIKSDSGRLTRSEFVIYKNALLSVLTQPYLHSQSVWECAEEGEWGMMDLLPRITPERLIETQGYGLEREDVETKVEKIRTYVKAHLQFGDPDAEVVARSSLPSASDSP